MKAGDVRSCSRGIETIVTVACMVALGAETRRTIADELDIIDQSQNEVDVVVGTPFRQPMGQTFIPSLTSIDFVELQMFDASLDSNGGSVFVRIREDSKTGDIVGTSPIVHLEDCFQFPAGPGCGMIATVVAPVRFDFFDSVPVTAGQSYLIEILHAGGDSLGVAFSSRNPYTNGAGFFDGSDAYALGVDLTFREGIVVPEPASAALLTAGVAVVAGSQWRRRKDRPY